MYDKPTNKVEIIDFDHAFEVKDKKKSLEKNKAGILWLLKALNDKEKSAAYIYSTPEKEFEKYPSDD